jgi:FKBP-type peptidyl-prolyl cis-trans isomerase FklB
MAAVAAWIAISISTPAMAQNKPTDPAAEAQGAQETPPPSSLTEKASYVIGRNLIEDFKSQEIAIDLEQLVAGIRSAAAGSASVLTAEDADAAMAAFYKRLEQRAQERLKSDADKNMRASEAFLKEHALVEGVVQLDNGVQYRILQPGSGAKPAMTDQINVHYTGKKLDGTVFESTRELEKPLQLTVGAIGVRGLMDSVLRMPAGSKWEIVVPPEMAYGVAGLPPGIGPNETLIFEFELISIEKRPMPK